MSVLTEGKRPGDWLKGEQHDPRDFSREVVTILAGSGAVRALTSGMVLGKVSKGAASAAAGTNTGNGTMGAITVGAAAKVGAYRLTIIEPGTNVGKFVVEDPDGIIIGNGTVAAAFSAGGLGFTLADGSTDFAAGDEFVITVAAGSGKFVQIEDSGTTGIEDAFAILYTDVTAPDGTDVKATVIMRNAVVSANGITWPSDFDSDEKAAAVAQLLTQGILVREGA